MAIMSKRFDFLLLWFSSYLKARRNEAYTEKHPVFEGLESQGA